jgi:hypothetical protein
MSTCGTEANARRTDDNRNPNQNAQHNMVVVHCYIKTYTTEGNCEDESYSSFIRPTIKGLSPFACRFFWFL